MLICFILIFNFSDVETLVEDVDNVVTNELELGDSGAFAGVNIVPESLMFSG